MIDRQHGKVLIVCDSCPDTVTGDQGQEFKEVWEKAKEDGWTCRKIAGEWLHGCPDCGAPT